MTNADTAESFPAMLRRVLGERLRPGAETFPDMFAVDGVLELPFAPPGFKTPLEGRDAVAAHFRRVMELIRLDGMSEVVAHETGDPEVLVVEFAASGQGLATGEPYGQRYVSVIRVRGGEIVHYRDYWNPIAVLRTLKGEGIMDAFTVG